MRTMTLIAATMLAATAFGASAAPKTTTPPATAHTVDLAGMDHSVKPGDDFFRYANGHWLAVTDIPADRSNWGLTPRLAEEVSQRVRDLIQKAGAAKAPPGSDARMIGDFYAAYMDEAGIEARGLAGLNGRLERVAAIADRKGLAESLGQTLVTDVDPINNTNLHTQHIFGLWVAQDFNRPDRNAPYLLQGGLGLPDREYYLDPSPRMADIRARYRAHVATVLKLAGIADPDGKAAMVVGLEQKIAQVHVSRADSEDVLKANNPWRRADFKTKAPGLDWDAFFDQARLGGQDEFIVWQPQAVTGEAALVASEPLEAWKAYLSVMALDQFADVLPKAFADEHFAFYGKLLSGAPQQQDRWKRAVAAVNAGLGDAVGRLYVQTYFPASAKAEIQGMTTNIKAAFARRIERLAWMAPATKAEAQAKLKTLVVGVGYPDAWRDYKDLQIKPDDALLDVYQAQRWEYRRDLAKLAQPVDRHEWWMTPQTVNAVNLPIQNALNFPAAILQPTYFDPKADPAVNYGAIGAVIGHEISHSFDDQGSQFDSTGKLRDWWTTQDFAHFKAAGDRLATQFDGYRPFPDAAVKGRQTLSENIADVAGINAAYDAWRLSLHGRPAPVIGGLTGDQRFFIAFAQEWRRKHREANLRQLLLTDGHAPSEYRADTVRNLDAWYAAFGVKPGQKLYLAPKERVRIW